MPHAFMLAIDAESEGPSKKPHPSAQAYCVPERLAPNNRTVEPAPLTRWLPDTLTFNADVLAVVVGGGVVVVTGGVVVLTGGVVVVATGGVVVTGGVGVVVGVGVGLGLCHLTCVVVRPLASAAVGASTANPAELPMIKTRAVTHVKVPFRLRAAMSAPPLVQ